MNFWDRLAAKSRPIGAFSTIEDPRTIVRIATATLWSAVVVAGFGAVAFFRYDEPGAGWAIGMLSCAYLLAWALYAATGSTLVATVISLISSAATNMYIHVELGGYANSGAIQMWAITLTLMAAVTLGRNVAIVVAFAFIAESVGFALAEQSLSDSRPAPDPSLSAVMFATVLVGTVLIVTPLFGYLLARLSFERRRAEELILNVLPAEVAAELKHHGSTTARRFESVSVLFADIVGFTPHSAAMKPEELVDGLNTVFTYFDGLAAEYGCEKIRTMGDSYMVAAGVPVPRNDHAQALAMVALAMLQFADGSPWQFRIGINSGPVVAGVIGTSKYQYDVWGDTVNIASRMESHGEPGRAQISQSTYDLVKEQFVCTRRGPIDVKGKGTLITWFLEAPQPGHVTRSPTVPLLGP